MSVEPVPSSSGRHADRLGDRPVGLLARSARALDRPDQARAHEHAHVEVEMARIDAETARQLPVRQLLAGLAQQLEHAQAERMPQGLDLLRAVDGENFERLGRGRRRVHSQRFINEPLDRCL